MEQLNVSYLPTLEDHINMTLEKLNMSVPKENKIIFRIIGAIAVMCATAGFIYLNENIIQTICWIILTAAGLFIISYYDITRPYLERSRASRFYNYHKKDICSKTVMIKDGKLIVSDEASKVKIPFDFIYRVRQTKNTVFIFYDEVHFCYIPVRVLSEAQIKELSELKNKGN